MFKALFVVLCRGAPKAAQGPPFFTALTVTVKMLRKFQYWQVAVTRIKLQ